MLPILYSFRRCPYAMRARLALKAVAISVELREILLRDKPQALRDVSAKATVPVLVLGSGEVIDQSRDIALWAAAQNAPLTGARLDTFSHWQQACDGYFKTWLDRYKYADRYPQQSAEDYRQQGEQFLQQLDQQLMQHAFLAGSEAGLVDLAIFPFVRQFAHVDKIWFAQSPYPHLQRWLEHWLNSPQFAAVMHKYPPWQQGDTPLVF